MDLANLKIDREPASYAAPKRSYWRWFLLLLVAVGIWWFRTPLKRFFVEARLPKVQVAEAYRPDKRAQAMTTGVSAGGYVVARVRAALSSDVPGRIVEMLVTEGSRVQQGEVVARLAHDEQETRVAVAKSNVLAAKSSLSAAQARTTALREALPGFGSAVESAKAELQRTKVDAAWTLGELQRIERLREQDLSNESELDAKKRASQVAKAGVRAAEAGVATAEFALTRGLAEVKSAEASEAEAIAVIGQFDAQLAEVEAVLDKTFVRAPFAGIVVLKDAEVGEVVSPNSQGGNSRGSVATLVDLSSLEAQVDLPELRISAIQIGGPVQIYLDAYPDEALPGRVDRIWPTANRQKATVEVRVAFNELHDRVRPEMGLRVVFENVEEGSVDGSLVRGPGATGEGANPGATPEVSEGIRVPERALVRGESGQGVFVLEGQRVRWVSVQSSERAGAEVVLQGDAVQAGDRVVLSAPDGLRDGDRVLLQER